MAANIQAGREEACTAPAAPADITAASAGYLWARDTVGESGGRVHRLHGKAGAPELYLKHGKDAVADDIGHEMVKLRWLADYLPVPAVTQFVRTQDEAWLLMTALPGHTAYQVMAARPDLQGAVVDALATFLRRLHVIPADACPFTSEHPYRLARARSRIDGDLVDEDDFDEERQGWTAQQVWQAMQDLLPFAPDPVVTHGDFSLDNLIIQGGDVVGCIDVGQAGIADRYQDLAIAWNCLGEFGPALQRRFLARYGIDQVDQRKLDFHLMLDELF
ncbi:aminoglycoside 3'-phosphotransferase [Pseudoduganella buxea]|uniref:Aminoglycoside 3'-phosphotransferase n=1 Tax=Pseudoduganella buxea TaxID=1949069 RepID=A0ABQ1KJ50_9BURK|nr:APH(3')-I family aminoglycoside O-phosphotransferase [Pseudoduganella buxea]GGC01490.1 aminoglycoside 3'-phosphotransferase [Pseudoduganella buxea]